MRALLQSISADPQMKQSKDTILLAEDKYPETWMLYLPSLRFQRHYKTQWHYSSGIETRVMQLMILL